MSIHTVTQIYLLLEIFSVTCILLSVSLHGWLNSNVPLNDLTIRAVLGNHVILRDQKGGPWRPELLGDLNWRGEWADLKGRMSDYSSYNEGTLKKNFSQSFKRFFCNMLFTVIKQINKQKLYNLKLSLPKQTTPSGSLNLPIQLIYGKFGPKAHNLKSRVFNIFPTFRPTLLVITNLSNPGFVSKHCIITEKMGCKNNILN